MTCRVSQNCHPSYILNFPLFHPDDLDTIKGKVKYIGSLSSSWTLGLNVTLLHVFHRSIAAAVQRIDPEMLRILGTILIPEDVLPSIAGVPEGDWLSFMWMVKAGAIRMADAGRGIELFEARRGDRRLNLWHIWDTESTKPVVSQIHRPNWSPGWYNQPAQETWSRAQTMGQW